MNNQQLLLEEADVGLIHTVLSGGGRDLDDLGFQLGSAAGEAAQSKAPPIGSLGGIELGDALADVLASLDRLTVDVRDLAQAVVDLVRKPALGGSLLAAGGPERISVKDLLVRLRRYSGRGDGPWVHLPLAPIRTALALLEPALRPVLPLTAGQLSSFVAANDGSAGPNVGAPAVDPTRARTLDEMIDHALAAS